MFELVKNRLLFCADDSTLLAVIHESADRAAIAASLKRDLARIQEWCNHWCKILNPNKTKALIVSRSRTVSPPHGDFVLSGVSICAIPYVGVLGVKFDTSSPSKTMCVILFPVCLGELVFWGLWNVYLWTALCYFVAILHSHKLGNVLWCCWMSPSASWAPGVFGGQALARLKFLVVVFDFVCAGLLCCTRLIWNIITVCSASFHLLLLEFDIPELRPQLIHWSLKYRCVEHPNFAWFSYRLRFDCGMTFPTVCLTPELWMGSRVQSTDGCFPELCFLQLPWRRCLWGCESNL